MDRHAVVGRVSRYRDRGGGLSRLAVARGERGGHAPSCPGDVFGIRDKQDASNPEPRQARVIHQRRECGWASGLPGGMSFRRAAGIVDKRLSRYTNKAALLCQEVRRGSCHLSVLGFQGPPCVPCARMVPGINRPSWGAAASARTNKTPSSAICSPIMTAADQNFPLGDISSPKNRFHRANCSFACKPPRLPSTRPFDGSCRC